MSRIGRLPIAVPAGVDVAIEGRHITVTGPKGSLSRDLHPEIAVSRDGKHRFSKPTADEMVAGKDAAKHPFRGF